MNKALSVLMEKRLTELACASERLDIRATKRDADTGLQGLDTDSKIIRGISQKP
jgi:hypothetical protein